MSRYVVAITGGVASGKSEVTRRFEALGIVVADADVAAREAVAIGSPGLVEVIAAFGESVLGPDGGLARAEMRARVFNDTATRQQLEAIVHPRVRQHLQAHCTAAGGAYAVAAIPLLTEIGGRDAYPWLDRIVLVDVPVELQRSRLVQRDGIDEDLAERMISVQATRAQRLAIADDIIVNAGPLDALDRHVEALDRRYRMLAAAAA